MAIVSLSNKEGVELVQFHVIGYDNLDIIVRADEMLQRLWSHKICTGGQMTACDYTERDIFFAVDENSDEKFTLKIIES